MSAGVLLPAAGNMMEPYILVWLGALLFLNLLRLIPSDLVAVFKKPRQLVILPIIKLVALPIGMYALAYVAYEPFALPILPAPFGHLYRPWCAICCKSNRRPASPCNRPDNYHIIAVPFVLPTIVYAFVRSQFEISLLHMMFLLSIALFTPLTAGWLTKKYFSPRFKIFRKNSFPLSLVFIIIINWGMFAKFAGSFYSEQMFLLQTVATAFLCYAVYCLVGYAATAGSPKRKWQVLSPQVISIMYLLRCLHFSSLARKLQRLLQCTIFHTTSEL